MKKWEWSLCFLLVTLLVSGFWLWLINRPNELISIVLANPKITVTETYVLIESTDILKVDIEQGKKYSVVISKADYERAIEEYEKNKSK